MNPMMLAAVSISADVAGSLPGFVAHSFLKHGSVEKHV